MLEVALWVYLAGMLITLALIALSPNPQGIPRGSARIIDLMAILWWPIFWVAIVLMLLFDDEDL